MGEQVSDGNEREVSDIHTVYQPLRNTEVIGLVGQQPARLPIVGATARSIRAIVSSPADGEGFELPSKTSGNQGFTNESGAECGALGAREAPLDPKLAAVIDAWSTLPEAIRAGILAMIRAGGAGDSGAG
ncbi:MAG: hypothetical protein A2V70_14805 [Planctomycetes bacterium RBG_13_63_9]|nr:MAG: hypothetical protein A2V70_14805 [Planctomycetes bacterium RBG_13_63_9]